MGTLSSALGLLLILTFMVVPSAYAAPQVITFEADPLGVKPNGYSPVGFPGVFLTDTVGAELEIVAADGTQCNSGQCLRVPTDVDGSALRIDFSFLATALSVTYGNDDPGFTAPGDVAIIQLFNGATLVGSVSQVLNRNDIMDQTISISGPAFNNALFFFGKPDGSTTTGPAPDGIDVGLVERVDNITFDTTAAVPEPGTLLLLGSGLAGLAAWRRRRE